MNNFDVYMVIIFIILIFVTIYYAIVVKYNQKIDNKIKNILNEDYQNMQLYNYFDKSNYDSNNDGVLNKYNYEILNSKPKFEDNNVVYNSKPYIDPYNGINDYKNDIPKFEINKVVPEKPKFIEDFIVADAQDFHNYPELRADVEKMPNNFNEADFKNPPPNKIVDYNTNNTNKNTTAFITKVDFGEDLPYPVVSCSNSSINNRNATGPIQLFPSQISCESPNKLTAENYYKIHHANAIPLEDKFVKGSNYMDFGDLSNPYEIDKRILSQNTKGLPPGETQYRNVPSGYNYAFYNTPVLPMP